MPTAMLIFDPAAATGARFCTVIVTVAGAELSLPSLTMRENVSAPAVVGAEKAGFTLVASLSATVGPPVCVQAYVR